MDFEICLLSLSCLKVQWLPRFSFLKDSIAFLLTVNWTHLALNTSPVTNRAKQPQSITEAWRSFQSTIQSGSSRPATDPKAHKVPELINSFTAQNPSKRYKYTSWVYLYSCAQIEVDFLCAFRSNTELFSIQYVLHCENCNFSVSCHQIFL